MARQLTTDAQIDAFIRKVIKKAHHHATNVEHVIEPLSDIVRAAMSQTDTIEVFERNGKLARTCWVTIGGDRYVFSYEYTSATIELRERTTRGSVLHSFDNSWAKKAIKQAIGSL